MGKILLVDNFDSFTYNLYHYLEELSTQHIDVVRNDRIDFEKLNQYSHIVISPGPGLPSDAGKLMSLLKRVESKKNILGICLGHQAIAEHFGMRLKNLSQVIHGQAKRIHIVSEKESLFDGLPKSFLVGRYHSWVIEKESLDENFEITATDNHGEIMAISHKTLPIKAMQFHPESILTEFGKEILKNWLTKKVKL